MIILPPEEKKSSPVVKWIFRILVVIVVFLGFGLFVLNILSGTSDAHRHGLEQALSDAFRQKIQISELKAFNMFPQFFVEMEAMQGEGAGGQKTFSAERVRIAFTFFDLLRKKGTFEDIQIANLRLNPGVLGQQELVIATAKIIPAAESAPARLTVQGDYGGIPFSGTIDLFSVPGRSRPAYLLGTDNDLDLHLGHFQLKGKLRQNHEGFPTIKEARLSLDGQAIAAGQIMLKPIAGEFAIHVEFRAGQSAGTVVHVPAQNRQDWAFETLSLDDVTADHPVWARVGKAWHDVLRPGSAQTGQGPKTVSVKIDKLTGKIAGKDLEGRFMSEPGQISGWWHGELTAIPENDKISGPGKVECGLIKLIPKGDTWISDIFLTRIGPVMLQSSVSVHEYTGKIKFQADRVESDPAAFHTRLRAFAAYKDKLKIGAGCANLPGLASP